MSGAEAHRREHLGFVLLIDGPVGVGTSTTMAALQAAWPQVRPGPLLNVGLDHALSAFGDQLAHWWQLIRPVPLSGSAPAQNSSGAPATHWGPLGRELVQAIPRVVAAWTSQGFDAGIAIALRDRTLARELLLGLGDSPRLHVGLTCDPDVLEDRARTSGPEQLADVRAADAAADLSVFGSLIHRDLILDTTESDTSELVEEILAAVRRKIA